MLNYQNVDIKVLQESQKVCEDYDKKLKEFGFKDTSLSPRLVINDEMKVISQIIKEVEEKLNYYSLVEDIKKVVHILGIRSKKQYYRRHFEDPRLPGRPELVFKDKGWKGWYYLFDKTPHNFYPTYEEAKFAVKRLGIQSRPRYIKEHKQDKR